MTAFLRITLAALVAAALGLAPALAQQPAPSKEPSKKDAELKAVEEQLERLLKEMAEREAKKAQKQEPKPVPPPPAPGKPLIVWAVEPDQLAADDGLAALRKLTKHSDPKVAALAKELLERLAKAAPDKGAPKPKTPDAGKPGVIEYQIQLGEIQFAPDGQIIEVRPAPKGKPEAPKDKPKVIEIELGPDVIIQGLPVEAKPAPKGKPEAPKQPKADKPIEMKIELGAEGLFSAIPIEIQQAPKGKPEAPKATGAEPAKAGSTLRMSTDGKTAAVISADGAVVVFDVATGRELMRFPAHK
jgi:hypothetical protein